MSGKLSRNAAPKGRNFFHVRISLIAVFAFSVLGLTAGAQAQQQPQTQSQNSGGKPNILVIFGDDIGQSNISAYTHGLMGYQTPNIDRIAHDGTMFTDYYAEQSCTAGPHRSIAALQQAQGVT